MSIENHLEDAVLYHESTSGQLPKASCYKFDVTDKGWRVEMDIWTEPCKSTDESHSAHPKYRTFLQLDTPITRLATLTFF